VDGCWHGEAFVLIMVIEELMKNCALSHGTSVVLVPLEMGMPHSIFIDLAEREYSPLVDTIWPSSHIALLKPF
jgi:hypothetical protein